MRAQIGDRLLDHATRSPDQPALLHGDRSWTYGEILALSRAFSDHLTGCELEAGHRLAIASGTGPEFVVAYFGAVLSGIVPVIVAPESLALLDPYVAASGGVVLAGAATPSSQSATRFGVHEINVNGSRLHARHHPGEPPPAPLPPRSGHIQYTSGTTGTAKAIAWSDARLDENGSGDWLFIGKVQGLLSPLHHAAGVQLLYKTFRVGNTLALIEQPHAVALAVEQLDRHHVYSIKCMPPHVDLILDSGVALPPCVEHIQVSGAPIDGTRLAAFAAHVAPAQVRKVYGTAESGGLAYLTADDFEAKGHTVGRPRAGVLVEIIDDNGVACTPGQTGEIVVVLPVVPDGDGYLSPTPEQSQRFCGRRLSTKDRGYIDQDGFLVLTERSEELIKSAGKLVSAIHLETTLRNALPGVQLAVARVPDPERGEAPCVVFVPEGAPTTQREWLAISQRQSPDYEAPRIFLPVPELPKTPSGKLARANLNTLAAAVVGAFPSRRAVGPRFCPVAPLSAGAALALTGIEPGHDGRAALGFIASSTTGPGARLVLEYLDGNAIAALHWIGDEEPDASSWINDAMSRLAGIAAALSGSHRSLTLLAPPRTIAATHLAEGDRFWLWSVGDGLPISGSDATALLRAFETR